MEYEHIVTLVREVSKAGLSHFEYNEGDVHISMGCEAKESFNVKAADETENEELKTEISTTIVPMESKIIEDEGNTQIVTSPLVGTFYSAPSEHAESYVKVGDRVAKGQTLAIVEAMKLMNEIESDFDGIVTEILVTNESPVEYGQPLFKIS